MLRKFTFWLTLLAVAICFFNAIGYDRDNMLLYTISAPAWVLEMIFDVHNIHVFWVYLSTVVFWLVVGYLVDRVLERKRETST